VYRAKLGTNESKFTFTCHELPILGKMQYHYVTYAFNGTNVRVKLDENNRFDVVLKPGEYVFQIYHSEKYFEITTEKITIKPQFKTYVSCYFSEAEYEPAIAEKPVIYLYPEKNILAEVKVKPVGELTFTYPEYNDGWKVDASPSGDLSTSQGTFNYLFWEAQTTYFALDSKSEGFIVNKKDVKAFLEEKLTEFGLNSKEQADFITYWGPQLMKNERSIVQFHFNDEVDQFAELEVTPTPDKIYRIYMVSAEIPDGTIMNNSNQEIPKMKREGFVVLEWGGSTVSFNNHQCYLKD